MSIRRMLPQTLALITTLGFAAAPALAAEIVWQDAKVMLRDGDSGFAMHRRTGEIMKLRLTGFDTPEPSEGHADCIEEQRWGIEAGIEAQRLVTTTPLDVVWQDNNDDGVIDVGKYKRGLGKVVLKFPDGRQSTLYAELVLPQLALPYEGGTRPDWCRFLEHLLTERPIATPTD